MFAGQKTMRQEQERSRIGDHLFSSSITVQRSLSCAWCLSEQGLEMGNGSHGICIQHANELLQQQKDRSARLMPLSR
jgi:hypothetical protein